MVDSKKTYRKYKLGDKYSNLCMHEKLAIAIYNNTNKLFNQRSEIRNVYRHKKKLAGW